MVQEELVVPWRPAAAAAAAADMAMAMAVVAGLQVYGDDAARGLRLFSLAEAIHSSQKQVRARAACRAWLCPPCCSHSQARAAVSLRAVRPVYLPTVNDTRPVATMPWPAGTAAGGVRQGGAVRVCQQPPGRRHALGAGH